MGKRQGEKEGGRETRWFEYECRSLKMRDQVGRRRREKQWKWNKREEEPCPCKMRL
jgi:hypothetical protein